MKWFVPALLLVIIAGAAEAVYRSPFGIAAQDREHIAETNSPQHWTGTDDLGRDRTVRLACALLLGLAGATSASALATGIAASVGVLAAFAPRKLSCCLLYLSDLFLTLPWLFLLMIVRSALPLTMPPLQSVVVTFFVLGLLAWPAYARITFAYAVTARNSDWLLYARASGLRMDQLARSHIFPRLRSLIVSQFVILIPVCIVAEANLGALGLGVSEPMASWGSMLLELQHPAALASSRWVFLPIALLITVLFLIETTVEVSHGRA